MEESSTATTSTEQKLLRAQKLKKAVIEGFIIFIAVVLGFIADDIRESRNLVKQKNDVLLTIYTDLGADIAFARNLSKTLSQSADSGFQFYQQVKTPDEFTGEEVKQHLSQLFEGAPLRQNRAGYESGKAQNLITQIDSRQLQRSIGNYYEGTSTHLYTVNQMLIELFMQLLKHLTIAVEIDPYSANSMLGTITDLHAVSNEQLAQLRASTYNYAMFARLYAAQLNFIASEMERLQSEIESELLEHDIIIDDASPNT